MTYRIDDEPQPSALAKWVVDPLWPLFAIMFGGAVLSWAWFVWNGFAVGSPTKRRELGLAIGGLLGSALLLFGLVGLYASEALGELGFKYALIVLTVWKLGVSYWLYILQGRSFHLYQYFGGEVKNGFFLAFIGGFLFRRAFTDLGLGSFWTAILL